MKASGVPSGALLCQRAPKDCDLHPEIVLGQSNLTASIQLILKLWVFNCVGIFSCDFKKVFHYFEAIDAVLRAKDLPALHIVTQDQFELQSVLQFSIKPELLDTTYMSCLIHPVVVSSRQLLIIAAANDYIFDSYLIHLALHYLLYFYESTIN